MKIWHVSDTHGYHDLLEVPDNIDLIIVSGDGSNYKDMYKNEVEVRALITWLERLNIPNKIYVAGNHDTSIEKGLITQDNFHQSCIHYLFNESITVDGIKIWGSPHTPNFGNWAFMKARHNLDKVWQSIEDDVDIVVTHTPPKGILDLSYNRRGELEFCGCSALQKRLLKLKPKLSLFGHIHNCEGVINAGTMKLSIMDTVFSNGSVLTDGKFGKLSSNGNIFEIV